MKLSNIVQDVVLLSGLVYVGYIIYKEYKNPDRGKDNATLLQEHLDEFDKRQEKLREEKYSDRIRRSGI